MNRQFRRWGESHAPCKDCTLRFRGCHDACPKDNMEEYNYTGYRAFKAEMETERLARQKFLREQDEVTAVLIAGRKR